MLWRNKLRVAVAAKSAADSTTATAASSAAHKVEFLEYKLSSQEKLFEVKLAAATNLARLEERISVAGLQQN